MEVVLEKQDWMEAIANETLKIMDTRYGEFSTSFVIDKPTSEMPYSQFSKKILEPALAKLTPLPEAENPNCVVKVQKKMVRVTMVYDSVNNWFLVQIDIVVRK